MAVEQDWSGDATRVGDEITELKRQIRDNERVWSGFRTIEVRILGARDLRELVTVLVEGIREAFSSVDYASIAYLDPDYRLSRLFAGDAQARRDRGPFISLSKPTLEALFPEFPRPRLGACSATIQSTVFPGYQQRLQSMALTPLLLRGEFVGALNQGSRHPRHYDEQTATDFLEHLAAVTAMCVDNVVNRERLKLDGLTDELTGVANRRFFERRTGEELIRWRRRGGSLVCMLVDIDHFKQVNDQYGHQAGDRVLTQIAGLLGRDLRASDVLARYGGEEFVLLLPETSEQQGAAIAERLRQVIGHAKFDIDQPTPLSVTISAGLAVLDRRTGPLAEDTGSWLLGQADGALYRAKQTGRNRVVVSS